MPNRRTKKVSFDEQVTYFEVPGHEEDRAGNWRAYNGGFLESIQLMKMQIVNVVEKKCFGQREGTPLPLCQIKKKISIF